MQSYPLLILRRDPTTSRPPSNYTLVDRLRFYDVWKRTAPSRTIVEHLSLAGEPGERTRGLCLDVVNGLRRAGPGAQLAYARIPAAIHAGPPASAPVGWGIDDQDYFPNAPGRLNLPVKVPSAGRYEVWLRGSIGRQVRVSVDGRPTATLRLDESYPYQYIPAGTATVRAGTHDIELLRAGGSLLPSTANDTAPDGATTRLGPVVLVPAGQFSRPVQRVAAKDALAVCLSATRLDWMDIVRP